MTESTIRQIPAEVNIEIAQGDIWTFDVDFDISLTGKTITAAMVEAGTGTEYPLTITNTDLSAGQVAVTIPSTASGRAVGIHKWYLKAAATGYSRRYFAGRFTIT